jgi:uncharacterized phage protein (TIGR02220 family)
MEGFYYTIPSDIFFDKNLSDKAKLLFGLVANFCNKYGKCFVSNKHLGETLDRSESTISRLVSELVDAGYLNSIVDKNDSNKRTLTIYAKMSIPIRKNAYTYTQKREDNNTIYNNTKYNIFKEVISYLNDKANTKFKDGNKANQRIISGRLDEGHTLEDFKTVIDNMVDKWKGTEWEQYLRPQTLFQASKFENYLNFTKPETKPNKIVI